MSLLNKHSDAAPEVLRQAIAFEAGREAPVCPSGESSSVGPAGAVVLLGASYGTKNMGVNALAAGTSASVFHSLPEAGFAFMDYSKEPGIYQVRSASGDREVPLYDIRFSKKLGLKNNIARLIVAAVIHRVLPRRLRKKIRAAHPALDNLLRSDIAVAISGGDSFSDIYGMSRLFYVCLPQILAIAAGRPLVLLPQTVGPFATAKGRSLARFILRRAKHIYSRDRESLEEVSRLLGTKAANASLAYDMGFALEPIPPDSSVVEQLAKLRASGILVGLNVSGLLYAGGYTGRNEFGLSDDYKALVSRLLSSLMALEGVQVLLVPHVLGSPESNESDLTACQRVYDEFAGSSGGRLHYLPGDYDHHGIKFLIGQCDFFLGSRMHACIAALSQSIPAVGLAYSRKFSGVFETIDCGELVIDLTTISTDEVILRVELLYQQRLEIGARLRAQMPEVKRSVLSLFKEISAIVRLTQKM